MAFAVLQPGAEVDAVAAEIRECAAVHHEVYEPVQEFLTDTEQVKLWALCARRG